MPSLFKAPVPPEARVGADPRAVLALGALSLSDGSPRLPRDLNLNLARVVTTAGVTEVRAWLSQPGRDVRYVGALAPLLPGAPFDLLYFELAAERYYVGRVHDSLPGNLDSVALQRVEADPRQWMAATRVGTTRDRIFVIPIPAEQAASWSVLAEARVATRESLRANAQRSAASGWAWSNAYDPPIDLFPHLKHP